MTVWYYCSCLYNMYVFIEYVQWRWACFLTRCWTTTTVQRCQCWKPTALWKTSFTLRRRTMHWKTSDECMLFALKIVCIYCVYILYICTYMYVSHLEYVCMNFKSLRFELPLFSIDLSGFITQPRTTSK